MRSVAAANVLTEAGYTHVRNIWEGFVGIYLRIPWGTDPISGVPLYRDGDMNHDGNVDDLDKNGWRYYQGLPYDTRLLPKLIYRDMAYLYDLD